MSRSAASLHYFIKVTGTSHIYAFIRDTFTAKEIRDVPSVGPHFFVSFETDYRQPDRSRTGGTECQKTKIGQQLQNFDRYAISVSALDRGSASPPSNVARDAGACVVARS